MLQTGSWAPVCWEPRSRGNSTGHFSPPCSGLRVGLSDTELGICKQTSAGLLCVCACVREGEPWHAHISATRAAEDELISPSLLGRAGRCGPYAPRRNCSGSSAGVSGPTAELVVPTTLLRGYEVWSVPHRRREGRRSLHPAALCRGWKSSAKESVNVFQWSLIFMWHANQTFSFNSLVLLW